MNGDKYSYEDFFNENESNNIENISEYDEILTIIKEFKYICVRIGRSQESEEDDGNYESLRKKIIANKEIYEYLPSFIKYNSTSYDYWQFIKHKFEYYAERDKFISDSFKKAVHHLELNSIGFTNEENEKISSGENQNGKKTRVKCSKIDENLCFVLMPFDEKFDGIYDLIKEELDNFNLNIIRADDINEPGTVIDDICNNIKNSKFLIAELTDLNPNVFYEVGYADALDKNIILIIQKSQNDSEKFPFDVSGKRMIIYEDTIAGQKNLKSKLQKYVRNITNR